jgi:rod shape-determining protein MreD
MRAWRIGILVVLFVVVQVTVFTHLRVFGVVPDLGLVLAVAIAYRQGPEAGALTGFAAGLLYDLFLTTPLAMSALSYALAAYAIGVVQTGMFRSPQWIPPLLGASAGLVGGLCFIGIGGLAGVPAMWTVHALTVVALSSVYDAVVAIPVFFLVNRLSRDEPPLVGTWSAR